MTLTPVRRALAVGAGAAAVLLLGLLTYLTTQRGRDAAAWVGHTYEVLYAAEAAQARAVDAETGVRGYAATGRREFLEPYLGARAAADRHHHQRRAAAGRSGRLEDGVQRRVQRQQHRPVEVEPA